MNKNLDKCIKVIKSGGIAIFPTDTAFGVGCRIDDISAVKKIFQIRKRPENKPILILASSFKMAAEYGEFNDDSHALAKKYWPGGLTIVVKTKKSVPEIVTGGTGTIGIRIPAHSTILKLVRKVGVPILAPSANFSGEKTPFKMTEIDQKFIKLVDFVMSGKCKIKVQSTVVDMSSGKLRVIRAGAVKL